MAEKDECIIPINWDAVWGELAAKHISKYDRSTTIVITTEDILIKHINNTINTITDNYTITTNTKLEVIKDIYLTDYNRANRSITVYNISKVTDLDYKEVNMLIDEWEKEIQSE